jgi:hypothetical protein
MSGLTLILLGIIAIAIFDVLAVTYGVDSRPEFDDPRARARGLSI